MQNCILWLNNKGGGQLSGLRKQHIYHSCIFDPNEGESLVKDDNQNFTADPKFAYLDPNNVHILYDSPCRDAGNPYLSYDEQVDMDRRERVHGTAIDVGAYEIDCEEISNELDFNADGLVNYAEFAVLSRTWLSCEPNFPGDPNNWNPMCNLNTIGDSAHKIDLADLMIFAEDVPWLWKACWLDIDQIQTTGIGSGEMLMMGDDFMGLEELRVSYEPMEQPELSIDQQINQLQDAIAFLEQIWMEDPLVQQEIDVQIWQAFMESVYQGLLELQSVDVQIE